MEVILLEKIGRLGNLGDRVTVKSGYGRNYLLPFGKAGSLRPAIGDNQVGVVDGVQVVRDHDTLSIV